MSSAPDIFESAADKVVATLPAPSRSWRSRLLDYVRQPPKTNRQDTESLIRLPLPAIDRLEASLSETSYDGTSTLPPTILYLAYGSNLCYETFQERRGIRPISAVNVVVPELELVFDLPGMPYIEPCFANSARREENKSSAVNQPWTEKSSLLDDTKQPRALIGVVYEVTDTDYARIIASEGPAYTDIVVQCHAIQSEQYSASNSVPKMGVFQAHTLLAPASNLRPRQPTEPAQASLRYMTLIRNGASEHNLPTEWKDYLNGLQHYHTTSVRQVIGKVLFVIIWAPIFLSTIALRRILDGKTSNTSNFVKSMTAAVFQSMWLSHDYFFQHVFGNGERTES